jgi:hypothetical protein
MKRVLKYGRLIACVAGLAVGACTLTGDAERPEIGRGTDDYKSSPCACNEVPQRYKQQFVG